MRRHRPERTDRPIEAPAPWIPHGERGTGGSEPELPVPVCRVCFEPIYYTRHVWRHIGYAAYRTHPAQPEEQA